MKAKPILQTTVILGMLVAVLAFVGGTLRSYWVRPNPDYVSQVLGFVQEHGTDPLFQVETVMVEAGAPVNGANWGVCLVQVQSANVPIFEATRTCRSSAGWGSLTGLTAFPPTRAVAASDGHAYRLEIRAEIMPQWVMGTILSLTAAGIAVAWLALATWIWYDARERAAGNSAAWLLIGFLTGPVGLAVWLVVRSDPYSAKCQHCGAERVPDTAFCVRCGHSLRAKCPACGKRVEDGWGHCGACGAPLNGSGGGENRVLADEDRAG